MNEQEIEALKAQIAERMEQGLKQFVGLQITDVAAATIKGYVENLLREALAMTGWPILGMIDIVMRMDGNTAHVSMKPKSDLSNADYRRVQAFLAGEEFW